MLDFLSVKWEGIGIKKHHLPSIFPGSQKLMYQESAERGKGRQIVPVRRWLRRRENGSWGRVTIAELVKNGQILDKGFTDESNEGLGNQNDCRVWSLCSEWVDGVVIDSCLFTNKSRAQFWTCQGWDACWISEWWCQACSWVCKSVVPEMV